MLKLCIQNFKTFGISMATEYLVNVEVSLRPVGEPWVTVSVHSQSHTIHLTEPTKVAFDFHAQAGSCELKVCHFGKTEFDVATAVEIEKISFFGISDPRLILAGSYCPQYPDHYSNKQSPLPGHSYLGWNGEYTLKFDVPVFTWLHGTLNLGWLYK
jgi:hypothetical protein